jgi:excisionase family DNA binding protein
MNHDSRLLTVSGAAAAMSISKPTVYRLMASGQLAWVQVGAHRRVTPAAIAEYIAAHTERVSA